MSPQQQEMNIEARVLATKENQDALKTPGKFEMIKLTEQMAPNMKEH
jgi:hypothetical protein